MAASAAARRAGDPGGRAVTAARRNAAALALIAALAGCAGSAPTPAWQSNARSAIDTATAAYLSGDPRVEVIEFERARQNIARSGRADLLARAELMRCATRVASLVFEPCTGFERLRTDASPAEQAYAAYLGGEQLASTVIEQLPEPQRVAARALAAGIGVPPAAAMPEDPLSRLIAIAMLFRAGQADAPLIAHATETASAQGWRRPLLAWLAVQAGLAERAGDAAEAARLRRRMAVVVGER